MVAIFLPVTTVEEVLLAASDAEAWMRLRGFRADLGDPSVPHGGVVRAPFSVVVHELDLSVSDLSGHDVSVLKVLAPVVAVVPPLTLIEEELGAASVDSSVTDSWCRRRGGMRDQVVAPGFGVVMSPFSIVVHVTGLAAVDDLGDSVIILEPLSPVLGVVSPLTIVVECFDALSVDVSVGDSWHLWSWCDFDHMLVPNSGVERHPFAVVEHHLGSSSIDDLFNDVIVLDVLSPVVVVVSPLAVVVKEFNSLAVDGSVGKSRLAWFWLFRHHEACPEFVVVWLPFSVKVHILDFSSVYVSVLNTLRGDVLSVVLVVVSPLAVEIDVSHPSAVDHSIGGSRGSWLDKASNWSDFVDVSVPKVDVIWLPLTVVVHVPDSSTVDSSVVEVGSSEILGVVLIIWSPLTVEVNISNSSAVDGSVHGSCLFGLSVAESTKSKHSQVPGSSNASKSDHP